MTAAPVRYLDRARLSLADVVQIAEAKKSGTGYMAKCPAHKDNRASLSISAGDKGGVVLHCHAHCSPQRVASALGIELSQLSPEKSEPRRIAGSGRGIVATYDYTDENGNLLFQATRTAGKEFRQRRPDGNGGWLYNIEGARRVPYRLPELIEGISLGQTVYIVEGEKDVENLRALGFTVTTSPMGAGKWSDRYAEHFKRADVIVLPDNDKPGRDHAATIERSLTGIAATVRIVELPSLPEKGDVSDWIRSGGSAEKLIELTAARPTSTTSKRPLVLKRLLEGQPPAPPVLCIDQFLLAGDINFVGGHGDAGKSVTLFSIAVSVVLGIPLFGTLEIKRRGPVVLVVPEDGEAVARHHVDAIIAGIPGGITEEQRQTLLCDLHIIGGDRSFNLLTDTRELGELIAAIKPAVVIADPLSNLIGGEDENEERVAQAACDNVRRDIAWPTGAAVVLAGHLRKPRSDQGASDKATFADIKGSGGWTNHSRIAWIISKPKGQNLITYRLEKSNRLPTGTEHQVTLAIEADPANAAHWLTCQLTDSNRGASSVSLTPGKGRALNINETKALECLDDTHEPGTRLSWAKWLGVSGLNANTFKTLKNRLHDAGLVAAVPTGKKTRNGSPEYSYKLTDEGRYALKSGWAIEHSKGDGLAKVDEGCLKGGHPFPPLTGGSVAVAQAAHPFTASPFANVDLSLPGFAE